MTPILIQEQKEENLLIEIYLGREHKEIIYYHPDHLGSSTLVTNQSGDVVDYISYLPYGCLL